MRFIAAATQKAISLSIVVHPLPFESEIFGAPVGRLKFSGQSDAEFSTDELQTAMERAKSDGAWLISCRLPQGHVAASMLPKFGFRLIERLVTLQRSLREPAEDGPRAARGCSNDTDRCVQIAREVFSFDRFHADPRISDSMADELKARWVANGFAGRADSIFVSRDGARPSGFLLCMRRQSTAVIDLIAVGKDDTGQGYASAMIRAAFDHYAAEADSMIVGTQADNLASIRLYESLGFSVLEEAETYHWVL